jgi:uncharacterized protein (DUF169 family)
MDTIAAYNALGEELERRLLLRTSPIAVKLLTSEADIPSGALRPKRDRGGHFALCQTLAMSRRQRLTVAMLAEDNWCWAPLLGFGLVACREGDESFRELAAHMGVADEATAKRMIDMLPKLEQGKYIGVVTAPLRAAPYLPDVVLVYSNTAQLRTMVWAVRNRAGRLISSQFDALDSCLYSIIPAFQTGDYRITLPDPGEYERAMAGEDEIIFSVPTSKLDELLAGIRQLDERKAGYSQLAMQLQPDFPQPPFYKRMFAAWGLDVAED